MKTIIGKKEFRLNVKLIDPPITPEPNDTKKHH
jgi:hypothetical protein